MKINVIGMLLIIAIPAQGSSGSNTPDEFVEGDQPKQNLSAVKPDTQPTPDSDNWKLKAEEHLLWLLERELLKKGKKLGGPIKKEDFAS